jgi:hypothetical protein
VGDVMSLDRLFSGDFTNSCHDIQIIRLLFQKWSAKDGIFFEMCKCFLKKILTVQLSNCPTVQFTRNPDGLSGGCRC